MRKLTRNRVIGFVLSLAMVPAVTTLAAPASAASKVTIKVWDPGLMGHLVNGALDTKASFIYKAKIAFEKQNPNIKINISELDGGVADTQFRAASIAKTDRISKLALLEAIPSHLLNFLSH
jgi:ABC-type glycerol-3-phosphate transport system substrate-binding protein